MDCNQLCKQASQDPDFDINNILSCSIDGAGNGSCHYVDAVAPCAVSGAGAGAGGCSSGPGCGFVYGRPVDGLAAPLLPAELDAVGRYLANAAYLEAASIDAFVILEAELHAHGAPPALIAKARRAAAQEAVHAQLMGGLAHRHGSPVPLPPQLTERAPRALVAMALENAIEGCIHETWSALIATWQAEHASEPSLRAIFARIAQEETEHAALAWEVAAWAEPLLSAPELRKLRQEQEQALARLQNPELAVFATEIQSLFGLPDAVAQQALVAGLVGSSVYLQLSSVPPHT
jgi:rubrerythrin